MLALALASTAKTQSIDTTRQAFHRLTGVYDCQSGEPLPGVQVRDAFTGDFATTSPTGTARLDVNAEPPSRR